MKKMSRTKKAVVIFAISVLILASIGIAGFFTTIDYRGSVATAKVTKTIVDYSGTWVYKDLTTHELVRLDYPSDDPNLLYLSRAKAKAHSGDDWDVDFIFENLFPCVDFTADFVFKYTGSIPVIISEVTFNADPWLQPYIRWEAYKCTGTVDEWVLTERIEIGDQIHYGEFIHIDVTVHLLQDNSLQDLQGSFSGGILLLQWNDECEKGLILPTTPVTMVVSEGSTQAYFDVELSDVPDGYTVVNGTYLGWCVDQGTTMPLDVPLVTILHNSLKPGNPYPDDDWDKVNYLINHKQGTLMQQQQAIWHFINGGYTGNDTVVLAMIADADANGVDYMPGSGQWIAVVCETPQAVAQWIFIEIDP